MDPEIVNSEECSDGEYPFDLGDDDDTTAGFEDIIDLNEEL
jgi:hypothetical protein